MARASEHEMELLHGALCGYFLKLIDGEIPELVEATIIKTDTETGEQTTYKRGRKRASWSAPLPVKSPSWRSSSRTTPSRAPGEGSDLQELERSSPSATSAEASCPLPPT
jgi:hypothetical protein